MSDNFTNEPMLDLFIFETVKQTEQLEQLIIDNEKSSCYTQDAINEIFRIMHTIKGSAAMMLFDNISTLSRTIEDLFYFLREEKPKKMDCSTLSDLVLEGVDFIKVEMEKIKSGAKADDEAGELSKKIRDFLAKLKKGGSSVATPTAVSETEEEKHQYYISQDKAAAAAGKNSFKAVLRFEDG
ncbi:MAG: Hpt domain-containing protein [Caulobacteraceae bacterium]